MDDFKQTSENFWTWLQQRDGVILSDTIALHDYRNSNQGRGLIAKENISKDELLFTITEGTLLSTKTSELGSKLPGLQNLDEWMSLILVMLYENQRPSSLWKPYFGISLKIIPDTDILPSKFDTPMFWNDEELKDLQGTEVTPRIGKTKSEEQYQKILLPLLTANPQLFDLNKCGSDAFHRMGSLVLAYSFGKNGDESDDDDDTEEETKYEIAMVPLADMLNADPQLNNARLFQAGTGWEMRSIKPIPKGGQIYNTYGNLPNSDLLRRYGYVIPGSKGDIVEITSEMVIETLSTLTKEEVERRVEVLDDEDMFEEAYEIPYSGKIPEEMYVFCLSILANTLTPETIPDYTKTAELRTAVLKVIAKRVAAYNTSIEEDEKLLQGELPIRKRMAIEVRLGEKRILKKAHDRVAGWDTEPPTKRQKR